MIEAGKLSFKLARQMFAESSQTPQTMSEPTKVCRNDFVCYEVR